MAPPPDAAAGWASRPPVTPEDPPAHDVFRRTSEQVHARYAGRSTGALAGHLPVPTRADPSFAYAMALDEHGPAVVEQRVGVEPSGEAFDSISLGLQTDRPGAR